MRLNSPLGSLYFSLMITRTFKSHLVGRPSDLGPRSRRISIRFYLDLDTIRTRSLCLYTDHFFFSRLRYTPTAVRSKPVEKSKRFDILPSTCGHPVRPVRPRYYYADRYNSHVYTYIYAEVSGIRFDLAVAIPP